MKLGECWVDGLGMGDVRVYPEEFREEIAIGDFQQICHSRDLSLEFRLLRYLTETGEMVERMRDFDRDGRDRYRDIRPFVDNIVRGLDDVYVNASLISGNRSFIVSQAPNQKTIPEWLGMLSRHQVQIVFCLTVCDSKQRQCSKYWPDLVGRTDTYGPVAVTLVRQCEESSGLIRRELRVEFPDDAADFSFTHIQFTQWPDHGVPELAAVLPVVTAVDEARRLSPVAVHCSAGIGRAGTLVAIAKCLEKARTCGRVSVLEECLKLRQERPFLVQTTAQYELIYEVLRHIFSLKSS